MKLSDFAIQWLLNSNELSVLTAYWNANSAVTNQLAQLSKPGPSTSSCSLEDPCWGLLETLPITCARYCCSGTSCICQNSKYRWWWHAEFIIDLTSRFWFCVREERERNFEQQSSIDLKEKASCSIITFTSSRRTSLNLWSPPKNLW